MKSNYFKTKSGYTLHYQVSENILPTTTVFIHGNVASNRWWIPTEEIFEKASRGLGQNGDMICIEFLGCGKSEAPKKADDVNLIQFASDFIDLLQDYKTNRKPTEKFNLVGHSTGGFIAAAMTALNSDMFNKAVLLDPAGAKGLTLTDQIKAGFEAMQSDRNITAAAIGATIYKNDSQSDFFNSVIVADAFAAVKNISYWIVQAFHNLDATELLSKSTTPTLVLHGEQDFLLSRDESEALALKYLKCGRFELVPEAGHCLNVEDPQRFADKISQFLF